MKPTKVTRALVTLQAQTKPFWISACLTAQFNCMLVQFLQLSQIRESPSKPIRIRNRNKELKVTRLVPEEAVDIFKPLRNEVVGDGLCVVGETQILQRVEQQRRVIVECSDGHLQAHCPQLACLHLSCQTLQSRGYKQRNHLRRQTMWLFPQFHYKLLGILLKWRIRLV